MTGCVSKPKSDLVLPPRPVREELPDPNNLKDCVAQLKYYEELVEEWENWGDTVLLMIEN